jgi:hypothetical protein
MPVGGRVMHAVSVVLMEARSGNGDDNIREWEFYVRVVDPIATEVVAADEPWAAYHAANKASDVLVDDLTWLPHGGAVYVAWASLTDKYEVGSSTPEEAHQVLRKAAQDWLGKPSGPDSDWLAAWTVSITGGEASPG